ncbi:hypothetical protein ACPUEN_10535 [Algoriphagus yeomjeoni]|uniref:hypothetical protein n=1 Tax=Algoriphagus yeomjeoni TaxID=291403 RepID=UPI003CE59C3F
MEGEKVAEADINEFKFQGGWKKCYQQKNCETKTGKRYPIELVWCEIKDDGCERVGDAVCECRLFRRNAMLPKEKQEWEHVPYEGKHIKEENFIYKCFCVRKTK